MDAWLLAKQAQIYGINAEIAGMQAENQIRIQCNEDLAYSETYFQDKARKLYEICNEIIHR